MPAVELEAINISDYLHVKGVRLAEPGMPQWKFKPLREKNLQLISEHLERAEQEKKEEEKWSAIPEWKRPLLREKERKKKEQEETQRQTEEAERQERAKFESLPEWKQKVLKKRKSISDTNSDTKSENSGNSEHGNTDAPLITQDDSNNGLADLGEDNSEGQIDESEPLNANS